MTFPEPVTGPDGPLRDLPWARAEGDYLEHDHRAQHVTGDKATVAATARVAGQVGWLHLGVHGRVDPDRPADSAIFLADEDDGSPGRLGPAVLVTSAWAVFLAACTLGRAGRRLPDEAQGFPTALLAGGAGLVIAPLWPVNDKATYELVTFFYDRVLGDGLDPAEALAEAAGHVHELYDHDPTWAAWVLFGG